MVDRSPPPRHTPGRLKVTQVSLLPTAAARDAGRPALTPELLAATGARYSRSNDGLEAILAKINPADPDRAVDSIFKMVDYGHQSIADMVPVALFIDGVSLWLAYLVWSLCPTAGGQESSTRYLSLEADGLIPADQLGIEEKAAPAWRDDMARAFDAYRDALAFWETLGARRPELTRIPRALRDDPSDRARRQVARMERNFAFDRARYFLPVAASTNTMFLMSARGWVGLCQHLLSHPLPEPRRLGELIAEELKLCAPRLIRHAVPQPSTAAGIRESFRRLSATAARETPPDGEHPAGPSLDCALPPGANPADFPADLAHHPNRYAWIGEELRRVGVRFAWEAMAFAEIRDLNRHRTGNKHCPLLPRGFYAANDQLPPGEDPAALDALTRTGRAATVDAHRLLAAGDPTYVYRTLLGTQFPFEHLTTADKFLYEAELRTGAGAHYRYADHLREVLALWYERFPATRGLVLEGSAEPE